MSKENLESIVQNMIDDGVSEEDIASAINQYDLDEKANKSSSKVDKRWGKKDNLTDNKTDSEPRDYVYNSGTADTSYMPGSLIDERDRGIDLLDDGETYELDEQKALGLLTPSEDALPEVNNIVEPEPQQTTKTFETQEELDDYLKKPMTGEVPEVTITSGEDEEKIDFKGKRYYDNKINEIEVPEVTTNIDPNVLKGVYEKNKKYNKNINGKSVLPQFHIHNTIDPNEIVKKRVGTYVFDEDANDYVIKGMGAINTDGSGPAYVDVKKYDPYHIISTGGGPGEYNQKIPNKIGKSYFKTEEYLDLINTSFGPSTLFTTSFTTRDGETKYAVFSNTYVENKSKILVTPQNYDFYKTLDPDVKKPDLGTKVATKLPLLVYYNNAEQAWEEAKVNKDQGYLTFDTEEEAIEYINNFINNPISGKRYIMPSEYDGTLYESFNSQAGGEEIEQQLLGEIEVGEVSPYNPEYVFPDNTEFSLWKGESIAEYDYWNYKYYLDDELKRTKLYYRERDNFIENNYRLSDDAESHLLGLGEISVSELPNSIAQYFPGKKTIPLIDIVKALIKYRDELTLGLISADEYKFITDAWQDTQEYYNAYDFDIDQATNAYQYNWIRDAITELLSYLQDDQKTREPGKAYTVVGIADFKEIFDVIEQVDPRTAEELKQIIEYTSPIQDLFSTLKEKDLTDKNIFKKLKKWAKKHVANKGKINDIAENGDHKKNWEFISDVFNFFKSGKKRGTFVNNLAESIIEGIMDIDDVDPLNIDEYHLEQFLYGIGDHYVKMPNGEMKLVSGELIYESLIDPITNQLSLKNQISIIFLYEQAILSQQIIYNSLMEQYSRELEIMANDTYKWIQTDPTKEDFLQPVRMTGEQIQKEYNEMMLFFSENGEYNRFLNYSKKVINYGFDKNKNLYVTNNPIFQDAIDDLNDDVRDIVQQITEEYAGWLLTFENENQRLPTAEEIKAKQSELDVKLLDYQEKVIDSWKSRKDVSELLEASDFASTNLDVLLYGEKRGEDGVLRWDAEDIAKTGKYALPYHDATTLEELEGQPMSQEYKAKVLKDFETKIRINLERRNMWFGKDLESPEDDHVFVELLRTMEQFKNLLGGNTFVGYDEKGLAKYEYTPGVIKTKIKNLTKNLKRFNELHLDAKEKYAQIQKKQHETIWRIPLAIATLGLTELVGATTGFKAWEYTSYVTYGVHDLVEQLDTLVELVAYDGVQEVLALKNSEMIRLEPMSFGPSFMYDEAKFKDGDDEITVQVKNGQIAGILKNGEGITISNPDYDRVNNLVAENLTSLEFETTFSAGRITQTVVGEGTFMALTILATGGVGTAASYGVRGTSWVSRFIRGTIITGQKLLGITPNANQIVNISRRATMGYMYGQRSGFLSMGEYRLINPQDEEGAYAYGVYNAIITAVIAQINIEGFWRVDLLDDAALASQFSKMNTKRGLRSITIGDKTFKFKTPLKGYTLENIKIFSKQVAIMIGAENIEEFSELYFSKVVADLTDRMNRGDFSYNKMYSETTGDELIETFIVTSLASGTIGSVFSYKNIKDRQNWETMFMSIMDKLKSTGGDLSSVKRKAQDLYDKGDLTSLYLEPDPITGKVPLKENGEPYTKKEAEAQAELDLKNTLRTLTEIESVYKNNRQEIINWRPHEQQIYIQLLTEQADLKRRINNNEGDVEKLREELKKVEENLEKVRSGDAYFTVEDSKVMFVSAAELIKRQGLLFEIFGLDVVKLENETDSDYHARIDKRLKELLDYRKENGVENMKVNDPKGYKLLTDFETKMESWKSKHDKEIDEKTRQDIEEENKKGKNLDVNDKRTFKIYKQKRLYYEYQNILYDATQQLRDKKHEDQLKENEEEFIKQKKRGKIVIDKNTDINKLLALCITDRQRKLVEDVKKLQAQIKLENADVKITLYWDPQLYATETGKDFDNGGNIETNKNNPRKGRIDINMVYAKENVVNHEGTHFWYDLLKITNPKLHEQIKNTVVDYIRNNPECGAYIRFGDLYKQQGDERITDEMVVEFLADLMDGDIKMDAGKKYKFLTGLRVYLSSNDIKTGDLSNDQVIDIIANIINKYEGGEKLVKFSELNADTTDLEIDTDETVTKDSKTNKKYVLETKDGNRIDVGAEINKLYNQDPVKNMPKIRELMEMIIRNEAYRTRATGGRFVDLPEFDMDEFVAETLTDMITYMYDGQKNAFDPLTNDKKDANGNPDYFGWITTRGTPYFMVGMFTALKSGNVTAPGFTADIGEADAAIDETKLPTDDDTDVTVETTTTDTETLTLLTDNIDLNKDITVKKKIINFYDTLLEKIEKLAGGKRLTDIAMDEDVSKNRIKTHPFTTAIFNEGGESLRLEVQILMGKGGDPYRQFLIDNKKFLLEKLSTTYLSKNVPQVVEKYVNGVGWTTEWQGLKPGTKDGTIKREGNNQMMRTVKDPASKIDDDAFVSIYMTKKNEKWTRKQMKGELLEYQIAGELSLETFYTGLLDDGSEISIKWKERQDLKNRIIKEGYLGELSKMMERGDSKLSVNIRKMTQEQFDTLWLSLPLIGTELLKSGATDAKSIREVLVKTIGDLENEDGSLLYTAKNIKDLSNYLEKLIGRYSVVSVEAQEFTPLTEFFTEQVAVSRFEEALAKKYGLIGDDGKVIKLSESFDDLDKVIKHRNLPIKMANDWILSGKFTKLEVVKMMLKYYKHQCASAGKLGRGEVFVVDENGVVTKVKDVDTSNTQRYQVFESASDYLNHMVGDIDGVTIENGKVYVDGVLFEDDVKKVTQSTNARRKLSYDENKQLAKEAEVVLRAQLEWLSNEILNNKDSEYTVEDFLMLMMTLKSNMNTVLRASANLKYDAGGDAGVYEHMITAETMVQLLTDHYLNPENRDGKGRIKKEKKKELDQLFENYNVAIITTEMDNLLKDLGLQSSMNTDWTILDDGKSRYYNNLTFKNERLTTITNLEDGTVEGEAYVNISNSIDWNNVESEKNKKEEESKVIKDSKRIEYEDDIISLLDRFGTIDKNNLPTEIEAQIKGNKWRFRLRGPSAYDFSEFIYSLLPRNKRLRKEAKEFFQSTLIDPYRKGVSEQRKAERKLAERYKKILKNLPGLKNRLKKKVPGSDIYTNEHAVRVYLFNKNGHDIPAITPDEEAMLVDYVNNDPDLKAFADALQEATMEDKYVKPEGTWHGGNIATDIYNIGRVRRSDYLQEFLQNADIIFSEDVKNALREKYGNKYVEALEDILYRMQYGTTRRKNEGRIEKEVNDFVNNSVGAVMFVNARSAILQTLSVFNFIDWEVNNPFKAAKWIVTKPKEWLNAYLKLWNSDFMQSRMEGNSRGVTEAEIADALGGKKLTLNRLLGILFNRVGFWPTKMGDAFAICAGGASWYLSRREQLINEKTQQIIASEGEVRDLTQEEIAAIEEQALQETEAKALESQQSADPADISMEQAGGLGRILLAFTNTPQQYFRQQRKAVLDIYAGENVGANISKVIYFAAIQNFLFVTLQSAVFAALGEEDEEEITDDVLNSMLDNLVKGMGLSGQVLVQFKNGVMEYIDQEEKGWNADHAYTLIEFMNVSPTIGSKLRTLYSGIQTRKFNKEVIEADAFHILNPQSPEFQAMADVIQAFTNIPTSRITRKVNNIIASSDSEIEAWQRLCLVLGWNTWDIGVETKADALKRELKEKKKSTKQKEKEKKKKEELEKLLEPTIKEEIKEYEEDLENGEIEFDEEDYPTNKTYYCSNVNKSNKRCRAEVKKPGDKCTYHEDVEMRDDGKKVQCKKIKSNGSRCGNMTGAKSGLCPVHD